MTMLGISSIISILLIMIITFAAGNFLYIFMNSYIESKTSKNLTPMSGFCINGNEAVVFLKNTGTDEVALEGVSVFDANTGDEIEDHSWDKTNGSQAATTVEPGGVVKFTHSCHGTCVYKFLSGGIISQGVNVECATAPFPCSFQQAYWSVTSSEYGEAVWMIVEGSNCEGESVDFNVTDSMTGETINQAASSFDRASWTTPSENAGYSFTATLTDNASVSIGSSNVLDVFMHLHDFIFYIHPDLVTDMDFAKSVLPKYVEDMNYVMSKNTNREFLFDPDTGIVLTETKPQTDSAGTLPLVGYDIWAHANVSAMGYSHGGYSGYNRSGEGVLAGLKWHQIYDPETLGDGSDELQDYWRQINNMLHELGHVGAAAVSEYYSLATVEDRTGVSPILNISARDPNDAYWSDKQDFKLDPMLWNIYNDIEKDHPPSRLELLETVRYSDLTARILSGKCRFASEIPLPDMDNITVKVIDNVTALPITGARVRIWLVRSTSPYLSEERHDNLTDEEGKMRFAWGTQFYSNFHHLRLIKAYKEGYQAKAMYVSIFDAQMASVLHGETEWVIEIALNPV
jgi:hypothetical protein